MKLVPNFVSWPCGDRIDLKISTHDHIGNIYASLPDFRFFSFFFAFFEGDKVILRLFGLKIDLKIPQKSLTILKRVPTPPPISPKIVPDEA